MVSTVRSSTIETAHITSENVAKMTETQTPQTPKNCNSERTRHSVNLACTYEKSIG
jgi:hypothetical protein